MAVNDAEVAPDATVTEAGRVRSVLLLVSVTFEPPDGAAALSVAVQVVVPPPFTVPGLQTSEEMAGTVTTPPVADEESALPVAATA